MEENEKLKTEVVSVWSGDEKLSPITPKKVNKIGFYCLIIAGVLCFLLIVVPVILLKIINSQLKESYTLTAATQRLWSKIPGDRLINHVKIMSFYSIVDDDLYYKLKGVNMTMSKSLMYRKDMSIENLEIEGWMVSGDLKETYELDKSHNKPVAYKEKIRQIRPGFLKAVELIQSRSFS